MGYEPEDDGDAFGAGEAIAFLPSQKGSPALSGSTGGTGVRLPRLGRREVGEHRAEAREREGRAGGRASREFPAVQLLRAPNPVLKTWSYEKAIQEALGG